MTASRRASGESHELTPGAVAVVLAVFMGGAVVGLAVKGIVGAFVGALAGALVPAVVLGMRRIRAADRSLEAATPPSLEGLDQQQAAKVMTAVMGAAVGHVFRSDLLGKLEEAKQLAQSDPDAALAAVEALRQEHPHSPAVHAELARMHRAANAEAPAIDCATEAIRHALDGGMNPTAVRLFEEFAPLRDRFALAPRHYARLARVLRTRDQTEAADWCDARSRSE